MGPLLLITCSLLAAEPASAPPLPTISIDLASLDRPTFEALEEAGIYQGLVLRLVTERVALVDPKESSDIILRMEAGGRANELLITALGAEGTRSRRVSIQNLEQEEVRLRLIHASVELVRQVRALPPLAFTPGRVDRRPAFRLELDGGALWSAGKPGVLARLAGGFPVGPGEVGFGLVLHRPLSLPSDLELNELGLFAGIGTGERSVGARGRVTAGLDLGVWQHRWRWSGAREESGARLDGAGLLHGEASLVLGTSWRLGLTAGALGTLHERTHRTSSDRLWKAPRVRAFAGLSIGFGWTGN